MREPQGAKCASTSDTPLILATGLLQVRRELSQRGSAMDSQPRQEQRILIGSRKAAPGRHRDLKAGLA